ncbi:MAG: hypothetical protein RL033_4900 [Pseudomonadota bacterium]
MSARTSPPSVPRRLHWLVLGVSTSWLGCAEWLAVPDEPGLKDAPAPRVTTVAPPQWRPPLGESRYFSQHGWPTAVSGLGSGDPPLPSEQSETPTSGTLPSGTPTVETPSVVHGAGGSARLDAGREVETPVSDAAVPDPVIPPALCVGHEMFGICWYLGEPGASCEQTCAAHGGPDVDGAAHVGVARQGGSPEDCVLLLSALGQRYRARTVSREEDGVGCYLSADDGDPYWLSWPPFEPTACRSGVRIVCGCSD